MIKKNVIINEDSIKVMKELPEESVDLIFADPPYWMRIEKKLLRVEGTEFNGVDDEWDKFSNDEEYRNFTKEWLSACKRILKKDGSIWVIGGMQCIYTIGSIMQELDFWFLNDVVWQKTNPTPNFKGTRLNNSHETLIWAAKSKKSKFTFNYKTAKEINSEIAGYEEGERRQLGSVWKFPTVTGSERLKDEEGKKLHNTQKPEEMLYRIINISSKIGDIILDPFAGTMTTGKIAKQTGRNFIMIEKESKYCVFGKKRIEDTEVKIGDIENAVFDIKPKKAPLKDMIEKNFFKVGEEFYLKNIQHAKVFLTKEGKLEDANGKIIDIHTGASVFANKNVSRLNGFNHWHVKRDGKMILIDEIRQEYRKNIE